MPHDKQSHHQGRQHLLRVTALTPLHVGQGDVVRRNRDYADWRLEERKGSIVLEPGGPRRNPAPIPLRGQPDLRDYNELRLHLEDGCGHLLLPGSSLKGAMKTAWLGREFLRRKDEPGLRRALFAQDTDVLLDQLVGEEFHEDPWQNIALSDLAFAERRAERLQIWSMTGNAADKKTWDWAAKPRRWLLECIPPGAEGLSHLHLPWFQTWAGTRTHPVEATDLLFAVHSGSYNCLVKERRYWTQQGDPAKMQDLIAALDSLIEDVERFKSHEYLLRLGYGSGYASISGRLAMDHYTKDDKPALLEVVRPGNAHKYKGFPFPKSRRLTASQAPLGFVRLRLES